MAFAVTTRASGSVNYATGFTSASFTPSGNALLFCCAETGTDADPTSISGHDDTAWVSVGRAFIASESFWVWATITTASPVSEAVTVVNPYTTNLPYFIFEVTGATDPAAVLDAIGDIDVVTSYQTSPTTLALTFESAGGDSLTVLCASGQGGTLTDEAGYTEQYASDGLMISYIDSEDTTPSCTVTGTYPYVRAVAFEIFAEAGTSQIAGSSAVDFSAAATIRDKPVCAITSVNGDVAWDDGDSGLVIIGTGFLT